MGLVINSNLKIRYELNNVPVQKALSNFKRDLYKTCLKTEKESCNLLLERKKLQKECFILKVDSEQNLLHLQAWDELGFIYGIYEISRSILGVSNFWFWNDQQFQKKEGYMVPENYYLESKPFVVKLRGWFVNDEVLIHKWSVNRKKEEPWEMVFEALLRCGGNMTIPGTDKNSESYRSLAASMGLYITHHHAEPLGAPMFAREYPNLKASYEKYSEKFQDLWKRGIKEQKNFKVVWNLGFRGQGDRPFWEDDPQYQTPESRGKLMSRLIRLQYDMVKKELPNALCCTNLYGETMELYRDGYLNLPEDVVKIWADNGFGKMVSRRQMNHNPRIYALPSEQDKGCHGIYYHVSFYDLQAANHITMLPNPPEFVKKELQEVLQCGADDYWIINCSNVKPHVYSLSIVSELWKNGDIDVDAHRKKYVSEYYGKDNAKVIANCFSEYYKSAIFYGKCEDEHAGEQFANHGTRMLVSQYMKNKEEPSEDMIWAVDKPTLREQIEWFSERCDEGVRKYKHFLDVCQKTSTQIEELEKIQDAEQISRGEGPGAKRLFCDSLMLQGKIYFHSYCGAYQATKSLLYAMGKDYKKAFYHAGKAREQFVAGNCSMREREHGKWHNFYANDCQVDIKQSAVVLEGLMSYLRNLGDGPHFYHWQLEFLCSEEDRRVVLLLNTENHLKDLELYDLMKEKWDS